VLDPAVWNDLDRYEGCDVAHEPSSLFYRQKVRLLRPSLVAWVYFLGQRQFRGKLIGVSAPPTNNVRFEGWRLRITEPIEQRLSYRCMVAARTKNILSRCSL
jgi:hypothetical protein